jgi:hypothetical protein
VKQIVVWAIDVVSNDDERWRSVCASCLVARRCVKYSRSLVSLLAFVFGDRLTLRTLLDAAVFDPFAAAPAATPSQLSVRLACECVRSFLFTIHFCFTKIKVDDKLKRVLAVNQMSAQVGTRGRTVAREVVDTIE